MDGWVDGWVKKTIWRWWKFALSQKKPRNAVVERVFWVFPDFVSQSRGSRVALVLETEGQLGGQR